MGIIEVEKLTRIYKTKGKDDIIALNNVSFTVMKGEVFGLLGSNGAGKTTLIKILSTFLAPTEGNANIFGYNTFGEEKKIRKKINLVYGGERGLYWRLSAYDNLIYFGDLYLIPRKELKKRANALLRLVGLEEKKDLRIESFSKGMIQKIQIARGLINDPDVLFLDEPTIGLDPIAVEELHNIIRKLNDKGKTIILTTHYMEEADELCDRIGFLKNGKLLDIGNSRELKEKYLHNSEANLKELFFEVLQNANT